MAWRVVPVLRWSVCCRGMVPTKSSGRGSKRKNVNKKDVKKKEEKEKKKKEKKRFENKGYVKSDAGAM